MAKKLNFVHKAEDSLNGFEGIDLSTMAVPFLKLAQDLSQETRKSSGVQIEGLEPGMFFNNITKEILGTSVSVIILKFEHIYLEWKADRGGLVDRHTPENAARLAVDKTFGKWKTADGNDLTEYFTYFTLVEGREEEGPIVWSVTSTALKSAKELNRVMTTHMMTVEDEEGVSKKIKAVPYYLVFDLNSFLKNDGQNQWFIPTYKLSHYITETQYELIVAERKALPDKTVDYTLIENKSTASTEEYEDDDEL